MAFLLPTYMACSCEEPDVAETYENGGNLYGHGSPEGVVTASRGATYVDVDAPALYFKASGDNTNTGWS